MFQLFKSSTCIYNSAFCNTTTRNIFEFNSSPSTCCVVANPRYSEFDFCVMDI